MKIRVKTSGLLGRYLPPGSAPNAAELEIEEGTTPRDVMQLLGLPAEDSYLVILNGSTVPQAERKSRKLAADDRLAIMPPLKGG